MPRAEQTVAYSISPVVPTTAGTLPVFATTGNPSKATDSVFRQADDSHHIIVGLNASVNAAQPDNATAIVIGEDAIARGADTIVIGRGAVAGQVIQNDGAIAIGQGAPANGKNKIRIGSALAFGAAAGDDSIAIGTQCGVGGMASIAIGRSAIANLNGIAIGRDATTNGSSNGIAIGFAAAASNTGVNHESIAIGSSAAAGANNGKAAIAIGRGAQAVHALAISVIAIGDGAVANVSSGQQSIAIGAGATVTASNEIVFGDSANGNQIAIFTVRTLAGAGVKHRSGADGSWSVVDLANANTHLKTDASAVADNIRLLLWDVTAGVLKRVSRGIAGSGGAGFRLLRVID